jgi:hypothetical protein
MVHYLLKDNLKLILTHVFWFSCHWNTVLLVNRPLMNQKPM